MQRVRLKPDDHHLLLPDKKTWISLCEDVKHSMGPCEAILLMQKLCNQVHGSSSHQTSFSFSQHLQFISRTLCGDWVVCHCPANAIYIIQNFVSCHPTRFFFHIFLIWSWGHDMIHQFWQCQDFDSACSKGQRYSSAVQEWGLTCEKVKQFEFPYVWLCKRLRKEDKHEGNLI